MRRSFFWLRNFSFDHKHLGIFVLGVLLITRIGETAHRIRGRVALATTRDSGGKADEKTAQRLAGCKRIVYGLLNGLALLR